MGGMAAVCFASLSMRGKSFINFIKNTLNNNKYILLIIRVFNELPL